MEKNETPNTEQSSTPQQEGREGRSRHRHGRPAGGKGQQSQPQPRPQPQPAPQPAEPDEDAATAEDMQAFIEARRKDRLQSRQQSEPAAQPAAESEATESEATENWADPYLEPDPTVPHVEYKESPFLSHGCNQCPTSYVPVCSRHCHSCGKLDATNWMKGITPPQHSPFDCVEVRFKNNRKDFYRLPDGIAVTEGDVVAVEGMPGHDVGIVTLTGEACRIQMKKKHVDPSSPTLRKLFRRAKPMDIEKWAEAIQEESSALIKTRRIAESLDLVMKINDVEFQGDRCKAIFYYTADDRVDFRSLIKALADEFHVRVEMKQIGVRQEASKVGGIGTCGRELCCSTWLTNFQSVTTSVAKAQQILPNPQKLAGQCGKLKCCLNFEHEVYLDALKQFPPANTPIRFQKGLALYKKTDVFRGIMWYAYENENDLYAIPAESVKKIIEMNHNQEYPERLEDFQVELMSTSGLAQESNEAEFEQEIRRLADTGKEVVNEGAPAAGRQKGKGERPERRPARNDERNRGPRNDERSRQPRSDERGRQPKGDRNDRNRQPRGEERGRRNADRSNHANNPSASATKPTAE